MKETGRTSLIIFSLTVFLVILFDQLMKFFVSRNFFLNLIKNYGAGFSILKGQTWLFILAALIFIVIIIMNYGKIPKKNFPQIALALFLGGTISNLIDRLFLGYVIDYFDFRLFYNNLADIAISVGAVMIVYYYLFKKK